jgi:hypothetical protein
VAVVARFVMRKVPTIPTNASKTKKGRTIFCRMLDRRRPLGPTVIEIVSQDRYGRRCDWGLGPAKRLRYAIGARCGRLADENGVLAKVGWFLRGE